MLRDAHDGVDALRRVESKAAAAAFAIALLSAYAFAEDGAAYGLGFDPYPPPPPSEVAIGVAFAEATGSFAGAHYASSALLLDATADVFLRSSDWVPTSLRLGLRSTSDDNLSWGGAEVSMALHLGSVYTTRSSFAVGAALLAYDAEFESGAASDSTAVISASLRTCSPSSGAAHTMFEASYAGDGSLWCAHASFGVVWRMPESLSVSMSVVWSEFGDLDGDGPRIHTIARGGRLALRVRF